MKQRHIVGFFSDRGTALIIVSWQRRRDPGGRLNNSNILVEYDLVVHTLFIYVCIYNTSYVTNVCMHNILCIQYVRIHNNIFNIILCIHT